MPRDQQRPSVLAITSEVPWPLNRGGHARTFFLLQALATANRVRLIAPSSDPDARAERALRGAGIELLAVGVARRRQATEALRIAHATVAAEPYVLYRRHRWSAVRAALRSAIAQEQPDVCYLDHLDSFVYAGACGATPLVIDLHNIYSELAARTAMHQRQPLLRWFLDREAAALARIERRAVAAARVTLASCEKAQRYYTNLGARAVYLAPNGIDCAAFGSVQDTAPSGDPVILFPGEISSAPNINAAWFLATRVLPQVRAVIPGARLRIVAGAATPDARTLGRIDGVELMSTTSNPLSPFAEAHVAAVPVDVECGSRPEILAAFAAGVPVVSTPAAAEALDVIHGRDIWLTPRTKFADGVLQLLRDGKQAAAIAAHGRRLAMDRYDWSAIGRIARAAVAAAAHPVDHARMRERSRALPCAGSEMVS